MICAFVASSRSNATREGFVSSQSGNFPDAIMRHFDVTKARAGQALRRKRYPHLPQTYAARSSSRALSAPHVLQRAQANPNIRAPTPLWRTLPRTSSTTNRKGRSLPPSASNRSATAHGHFEGLSSCQRVRRSSGFSTEPQAHSDLRQRDFQRFEPLVGAKHPSPPGQQGSAPEESLKAPLTTSPGMADHSGRRA